MRKLKIFKLIIAQYKLNIYYYYYYYYYYHYYYSFGFNSSVAVELSLESTICLLQLQVLGGITVLLLEKANSVSLCRRP